MCWNFNGCGDFCGGDLGEWVGLVGVGGSGLKVAQRVDFGGVGCGRAWVISLPKFFLGKHSHFWKLPPLFCINSMSNVYYPIFLACYIVSKINIKYIVLCIISVCASVKMVLKVSVFYLGKARVGVLSLLHSPTHPPKPKPHTTTPTL